MTDAAQQVQTPTVGAVLGGRFRIVRRIGEGGMGVVLEAENTLTGKRVAIKWMHPQMAEQAGAAERMVREARASARVRHPNVVDVYDVVQEPGGIFLVMELLEGEPLTALLERNQSQPHEIIRHLLDAMRGVAAAHREGVIHRDIKPDNIFLAREPDRAAPIPKVLDFGISKLSEQGGAGLSLTRTGMTLGTPLYMSYEQLAGVRDIDGRTDVYAFGVILYESLTGQPPFNAETFSELIIKITTTLPPTPKSLRPALPGALSSIVETAMRRDRNERTPSLDALISALEPFASREGYAARVTSLGEAPIRKAASATPLSMPASVPPAEAEHTGGRVAVTSVRTLDSFSDPDAPRISSIPRSFTAGKAMLWGALAIAIAGGAFWFVSQQRAEVGPAGNDEPHVATPATDEPKPPPSAATPATPEASAKPEPAEAKPTTNKPVVEEPPATTTAKPGGTRPRPGKPREPAATTAPTAPAPTAQEPQRPRPPATNPRAGRPQSTEF